MKVLFSPEERAVLSRAGITDWFVPSEPAKAPDFERLPPGERQRLDSQYKVSRALIDGDAIDNYATLGGASKIVAIRGPGTMFADKTVWDSFASVDTSFKDAYSVLSPKGRALADRALSETTARVHDADNGIRAEMNSWIAEQGERVPRIKEGADAGKVAFLDAPLKYPEKLDAAESKQLADIDQKLKGADLPDSERSSLSSEAQKLRYKGLSADEIAQFEFAREIRAHMVDALRAQHRVNGDLPGNFEPARRGDGQSDGGG